MEEKKTEREIIDNIYKLTENINGFLMCKEWKDDLSSVHLLNILTRQLHSNFEELCKIKDNKQ